MKPNQEKKGLFGLRKYSLCLQWDSSLLFLVYNHYICNNSDFVIKINELFVTLCGSVEDTFTLEREYIEFTFKQLKKYLGSKISFVTVADICLKDRSSAFNQTVKVPTYTASGSMFSTEVMVTLDDLLNYCRIIQRAEVTQVITIVVNHLPQHPAHYLAWACLRKTLDELRGWENQRNQGMNVCTANSVFGIRLQLGISAT